MTDYCTHEEVNRFIDDLSAIIKSDKTHEADRELARRHKKSLLRMIKQGYQMVKANKEPNTILNFIKEQKKRNKILSRYSLGEQHLFMIIEEEVGKVIKNVDMEKLLENIRFRLEKNLIFIVKGSAP